ncbi:MAG: 6-hydroxymethylpterin diphosphokinase MptE-like protein [Nitrososphaerales archaeon]
MEFKEWQPWYDKIASAFKFNKNEDQRATDILSDLIQKNYIEPFDIRAIIYDKPILVFGAGPSLEDDIHRIEKAGLLDKLIIITADGATSALIEIANKVPHIIVTDLDGRFEDLLSANRRGSFIIVHGHGDNIPQLLDCIPKLTKILGTTQVEPRPRVYNFGGFTDGDRAVFLAAAMGAKMITLAGMDLGRTIGKYSKQYVISPERKLLKLKFCKKLLEWLALRAKIGLYNLTSHGERIKGFKDVTPQYIAQIS